MPKLILYFSLFTLLCLRMYGEVVQAPVNTIYDSANSRYLVTQNNNQLVAVDSAMTTSSVLLTLNTPASMCIQGNTLYLADYNKVIGYQLNTMTEVFRFVFTTDVSLKGITGDGNGNLYLSDGLNSEMYKLSTSNSGLTKLSIKFAEGTPKGVDYLDGNLYITTAVSSAINCSVYKYIIASDSLEKIYHSTSITGINSLTHDQFGNLYLCFYGASSTNGTVIKCTANDYTASTVKTNLSMPTSISYRRDIESIVLSLNPINQIGILLVGTAPKPVLIYPANNSSVEEYKVFFKWNEIYGVAGYNLWIAKDENFTDSVSLRTFNFISPVSTLIVLDTNTTFYWKVRGYNLGINGQWSETFSFKSGNRTYQPPVLISPANHLASAPLRPTFVWTKSNAGIYEMQISKNVEFNDLAYDVTNLTDTFHLIEHDLSPNSEYYWRVRTYSSNDNSSGWSLPSVFNTFSTPPATPELYYPADYAVNIPLLTVVEWMPVVNTKLYKVELSDNLDFPESDTQYFDVLPSNGTKEVLQLVDSLKFYKHYFWRVRGQNDYGLGAWSSIRAFQTINGNNSVDDNTANSILAYPNPAADYIYTNVELDANSQIGIELFNSLGEQQVQPDFGVMNNNNQIKIAISKLDKGYYLLRIRSGIKSYSVSFIKN